MSLFTQKEHSSTIRHYSSQNILPAEIEKISREVITAARKSLNKTSDPAQKILRLQKAGQLLWNSLLTKQVKEGLKNTFSSELILSLDEELITIPWELLYDGEQFFSLKFSLGRLIRTKGQISPPKYRSLSDSLKMLILADPTDDLKSAYLEGRYIRNQFDRLRNRIKIDFKSISIDTLYVKKYIRDYDIVHFAGHCEFNQGDPSRSGWVLNDGTFSSQDIIALAEGINFPNLIFSNACHSAETTGFDINTGLQESAYSLASAFLFSGVRHYIGSIWRIEDPVSLAFAREFYASLISGASVGDSIRRGRIKLVKEYGFDSLFWASYVLYGDPAFVFFKPSGKLLIKKKKFPVPLKDKLWKRSAIFLSAAAVIFYFIFSLPTVNPVAYFKFSRSSREFLNGRNHDAVGIAEDVIKIEPLFLPIYPLLAKAYLRMGESEKALKTYFEYLMQSEKKNDFVRMASGYIGIGWVYHLTGDYPKAWEFYEQALKLSRSKKDKLNEAASLGKMAVWYIDQEEYEKALELLTKSIEINRQKQQFFQYRYNLACDYFDVGLIFVNKDDFASAREFYAKSQRIFERLKLKHELSDCYFNLGEIHFYEKEYQKALIYYNKGLNLDLAHNNLPNLASDYAMIGELYLEIKDLEKAEDFFKKSLEISLGINAKPELASVYYDFGLLYKQKNQKVKAREYFRKSQELYRNMNLPGYKKIREELQRIDEI